MVPAVYPFQIQNNIITQIENPTISNFHQEKAKLVAWKHTHVQNSSRIMSMMNVVTPNEKPTPRRRRREFVEMVGTSNQHILCRLLVTQSIIQYEFSDICKNVVKEIRQSYVIMIA